MKNSKYNVIVPIDNQIVLFNTLSLNKIIFKDYEYKNIINNILQEPDVNLKEYPSLTNYFIEKGFLTDTTDIGEIETVRHLHRKEILENKQYHITINPTLECNFNCWYCSVNTAVKDKEKLQGKMSLVVLNSIIRHLELICTENKYNSIYIDWFGGEPLLNFYDIIEQLAVEIHKIATTHNIEFTQMITTNGSLINSGMIAKFKELNINNFQITIDGDEKKHNKIRNENGKDSFKIIMRNVLELNKELKDSFIYLRINYDNKTLENIDNIFSILNTAKDKRRIVIYFIGVWQVKHKKSTQLKLKEIINRLNDTGFVTKFPKYKPGQFISCYADRKSYKVINYDGNIYKCTARDYSDYHAIGKINENGIIEYNEKNVQYYYQNVFDNDKCIDCEILPICMGGCIQKLYEENIEQKDIFNSYCFKNFQKDYDVTDFVKDLINAST